MNPADYQRQAARTESDPLRSLQEFAREGMDNSVQSKLIPIRINHAVLGMITEVGELADQLKKWIYYRRPLDEKHVEEEIGDLMWYIALACNTIGCDLGEIMAANIRKLRARFPDKYEDRLAQEENRDRVAEQEAARRTAPSYHRPPTVEVAADGTYETCKGCSGMGYTICGYDGKLACRACAGSGKILVTKGVE